MASLSIGFAGETNSISMHSRRMKNLHAPSIQKPSSMVTMISRRKNDIVPVSKTMSMSLSRTNSLEPNRRKQKREEAVSSENLIDEWMKNSVVEIVKNLREAPLLVQVYSENGKATKLKTEKAVADEWPSMKWKWEEGTTASPEGVIFVERLKDEEEGESEITRAWGIVVQGRGENCGGPACYLLKTSRGGPLAGLGLCCTHFCLMKVKSFRETAEAQFEDCWLLN